MLQLLDSVKLAKRYFIKIGAELEHRQRANPLKLGENQEHFIKNVEYTSGIAL